MNLYSTENLSKAVAAICPDIQSRVQHKNHSIDDRHLWWELSSCILSSQVPYSLAAAAADKIDTDNILLEETHDLTNLTCRLVEILSTPLIVEGRPRLYRFPIARANYLAATRAIITSEKCSLQQLIYNFKDASEARSWIINNIPGAGPKQASMFLRNAGVSYDLAILDRHVLNYMSVLGIYTGTTRLISNLKNYHQCEVALRDHANNLDCPVGLLDWAIWIVMRVAKFKTGL